MKKFLSLVLSLAMTLSLVTISASATDYDDLTDKNEIKYEEAVAVLNKLGIITGYEDGSFKPTGALTRGAAAKIIVSLEIGADAASALTVTAAPYKDVPVANTFAAVISYCKTQGYINGYTDGTFRPSAALSGFAFAKMLLGAVGYRGDIEHFTGSGWTMNVAKLGKQAGLFDDFATEFAGGPTLDRESACLLALNTLKATEVEYTANGNNLEVNDKGNIVGASTNYTRDYVTSRNDNINQNISKEKSGNDSSYYTLEFGEEHFADLKLSKDGTGADDFGRPANEWTYKNVKIGTYPTAADYTYTSAPDGDTNVDEVKDMGLKDFYINNKTTLTVNGLDCTDELESSAAGVKTTSATNAAVFDKYTADGVLVEVYLDDDDADTIDSIVVIYTQLMQVNSVKSTEVTLKNIEDDGYLVKTVKSVKDDDDAFAALKDLKADDYVLVVPLKDGSSYKVDSVIIPQSVTGKMTNISTKSGNTKVKAITVAGTSYKMSKYWTSEDGKLSTSTTLSTTQDTTVYLDQYGYAIYVKNVTDSNSAIIIDEIYSSLVDGKIVKYAKGWNSDGDALELNLGNSPTYPTDPSTGTAYTDNSIQGHVFEYQVSTANSADYKLDAAVTGTGTSLSGTNLVYTVLTENQQIVAGQYVGYVTSNGGSISTPLALGATGTQSGKSLPFASDVKFIFESIDTDGDVTGITVNEGVTEVKKDIGLAGISYILNDKCTKIVAVVIPDDDDAANTANLLYVQKVTGYKNNDEGKRVALFTAYIDGEKVTDCEYTKEGLIGNAFYTYSKNDTTGAYSLTAYKKVDKITAVYYTGILNDARTAYVGDTLTTNNFQFGDDYFGTTLTGTKLTATSGYYVLNAKNAQVIDLYTDDGVDYTSVKDMKDAIGTTDVQGTITGFNVSYIFNGSDNTNAGKVDYVFVTKTNHSEAPVTPVAGDKYSTLVDTSADGLDNLDMSVAANYHIDTTNYTIDKFNAITGANLPTQVKDFLTYEGYTNIGKMSYTADSPAGYRVTATTSDGIDVEVSLATVTIKYFTNISVDGDGEYVAADTTTVHDICSSVPEDAASFAKLVNGTYEAGNAVVQSGHNYASASDEYVAVTLETAPTAPLTDNFNITYQVGTATATSTMPSYVKVGDTLKVILTAKQAVSDAANDTITFGKVADGDFTFTGVTGTSTTTKVATLNSALAIGNTVTAAYTAATTAPMALVSIVYASVT